MRLVSYYHPSLRIGDMRDELVVDLRAAYELRQLEVYHDSAAEAAALRACPADMSDFAEIWTGRAEELGAIADYVWDQLDTRSEWLERTGVVVPRESARLLPPVLSPTKIVNIGNAYLGHITNKAKKFGIPESEIEVPKDVKISFFKPASCLVADGMPITYPETAENRDFEGELAIIIGRHCRNVAPADALSHVLGYTIMNDASDRSVPDVQGGTTSPTAKGCDTFGPLGPWVVPREHMEHDPNDLSIRTFVNDTLWQDARTNELLWPLEEIVSTTSAFMTLVPGDIISTGSPPGMGLERGQYLQPGDVIRIEIEGIATLENPVAVGGGA